ncbi:LOW QUALITY PROTEIN: hypothetical protein ACHAXT_012143 [Thalassiosira profunda]
MAPLSKLKEAWAWPPPPHVEVTLRMGVTTTLAYAFTIWNNPIVTPINMGLLLGILAPFLVMLLPTLMFSFGSNTLPTLSTMFFSCVSSTLMFAVAVVGGDAAFVVCFGFWAFWVSFLRWDKGQGSKVGILFIMVILQTVLIWPTIETVQHGFTVPNPNLRPVVEEALQQYLEETVEAATLLGVGTHVLAVEAGVLEGREAAVTINEDGTSSTYVEGGMWLVTGMWTFSGVTNPLAAYQNFLIVTCWIIVFVGIAALLPPFRTIRSALWRRMLPTSLRDSASLLRLHVAGERDLPETEEDIIEAKARIAELRKKCVVHTNTLFYGRLAKLTNFEPRLRLLLECNLGLENTPAYLAELSMIAARLASASSGIERFTNSEFLSGQMETYEATATNIDICADALAKSDASLLEGVDLGAADHEAFAMRERTSSLLEVSKKWLRAMSSTGGAKDAGSCSPKSLTTYLWPWIYAHLSIYQFLFSFLVAPFRRSTWQSLRVKDTYAATKLVWNVKYALGMSICIVVSFYWPAFRYDFVVTGLDDPLRSELALRNGGWVIVSYCFATTQTAEGSVKKGVLRALGTGTGAFSAWLALIACEDSTFSSQYNSYGIVAWLSVTTVVAIYCAQQRGPAARIGLSNEHGWGLIYFIITSVIIVCNVVLTYGPKGRDGVVVNRIVANLVGIALSMALALLPPGLYGGDPGHTRKMNHYLWRSVEASLQLLLSCEVLDDSATCAEKMKELSDGIFSKAAKLQECVIDFEKDASRLNKFPLLRVTRSSYVVAFIPLLAARIMADEQGRELILDGVVRTELSDILVSMKSGHIRESEVDTFHLAPSEDVNLLVMVIRWLVCELDRHRNSLGDIKFGICTSQSGR